MPTKHLVSILAPDGNSLAEINYLLLVAKVWQLKMAKAKLTHNNAQFSLCSTILRKLIYPLSDTNFATDSCSSIMKLILADGLPQVGIVHTAPRALVHDPLCYCGFSIPNLYSEQFLAQLTMLLWHGQFSNDTTSIQIRASAEAQKFETRICGAFSNNPLIYKGLALETWLKRLWVQFKQSDYTHLYLTS